jgi:hypothetical protein
MSPNNNNRHTNLRSLFGLVLAIMLIVGISFPGVSMGKLALHTTSSGWISAHNSDRNISDFKYASNSGYASFIHITSNKFLLSQYPKLE